MLFCSEKFGLNFKIALWKISWQLTFLIDSFCDFLTVCLIMFFVNLTKCFLQNSDGEEVAEHNSVQPAHPKMVAKNSEVSAGKGSEGNSTNIDITW